MSKDEIISELMNYKSYLARKSNIKLEIDRIENDYQGIKGQSFEDTGGGGTNAITRSVENEVIKKQERIDELIRDLLYYEYKIKRIENALSPLTNLEKRVIGEKYFKGYDFYYIAEVVGYSYSWVKGTHKDAMNKLEMSF